MSLSLEPKTTAFVQIDLEHGIVGRQLAPYAGMDVVKRCKEVATAVRASGGMVVFVHVLLGEILRLPADKPMVPPGAPPPPPEASDLVPEAGVQAGDLMVTKRQWGAFYGTQLEQALRRRGIKTVVMGGIATNFGVESTAREALDRGFAMVFAEDAMTSMSAEMHRFSIENTFPVMGRVSSAAQIVEALKG